MNNKRYACIAAVLVALALSCNNTPNSTGGTNKGTTGSQFEFFSENLAAGNLKKIINAADSINSLPAIDNRLKEYADSVSQIAQRLYLCFSLNGSQIDARLENIFGKFSDEEKMEWEKKKWLEYRIIDGEKRYFNRAASNLSLLKMFYEDKSGRKKAAADDSIKIYRLNHTEKVIEASRNSSVPALPVKMKVTYTLTVNADAVPDGETIRCWLPLPQNGHPRQKFISLVEQSENSYILSPDTAIHTSIYMEKKAKSGEPAVFKAVFLYQSAAQYFNPDNIKAEAYDKNSELYKKYTSEQLPQIHFSEKIKMLADSIVSSDEKPNIIVDKIYTWFKDCIPWTGALEYSVMPDIPGYTLENRRGDCGMQTLLFMSMLRYKGVPVRWQSGWMVPAKGKNLHDWCEVYYEGTGWVPVDISYDLQVTENRQLKYFFMSGIDSYRLIVNNGISGPLHPAKKHLRSEPYDFQRGEVEWNGGNLYFDKWNYDMKVEPQQ
ncbi:MAG: transglutaminase domain-containing protein [Bacteroidales bacterium]|jgi:transglutaminase-like putative cysteine protease|nr:transglutaminase domain-containing protein [Bacteroidales bacterium]